MSYTINTIDGTGSNAASFQIADGTLDETNTTLALPGRNYSGYGPYVDQDLVNLTQSWAGNTPPGNGIASKLLAGQLWLNTSVATANVRQGTLNFYSGFNANVNPPSPQWSTIVASDGNIDTNISNFRGILNITGANGILNASQQINSSNTMSVTNVFQVGSNSTPVVVITNNTSNTFYVTGNSTFANGTSTTVANLITSNITPTGNTGILNLNWTILGNTIINGNTNIGGNLYATGWGNFQDTQVRGNLLVDGNSQFDGNVNITGNLTLPSSASVPAKGPEGAIQFATSNGNGGFQSNSVSSLIYSTSNSAMEAGNLTIVGLGTLKTRTLSTGDSSTTGTITGNWSLSSGSKLNATYADLAERFAADAYYEPGTVVELGGIKEITAVVKELSDRVFGVISNTAGYIMNGMAGNDITHPQVAMTGRVQVKVKGRVNKGDRLVSAGNGYARAAKDGEFSPYNTIGRALEDKLTTDTGTVLAAVSVRT